MCQDVSKISYFLLPNDERRSLWLINSGNTSLLATNGNLKRYVYICEEHFDDKYLLRSGQRIQLSKSAVPKVFSTTKRTGEQSHHDGGCTRMDEEILWILKQINGTDQ